MIETVRLEIPKSLELSIKKSHKTAFPVLCLSCKDVRVDRCHSRLSCSIYIVSLLTPMIIKLNVGGQTFVTTDDTLSDKGDNMLSLMIRHQNPARLIDGHYFIDRDPVTFRWVLNYLRGSKVLPSKESIEMLLLKEEADFYAMDELTCRIQHMVSPRFSKNELVSVKGTKFTIMEVNDTGYIVSRLGKCFQIYPENVEYCCIEIGDAVMAWNKSVHKRMPGICMGIQGKNYIIQFHLTEGQEDCPKSGVRF